MVAGDHQFGRNADQRRLQHLLGHLALRHADLLMAACVDNELVDFDLAYAHEARVWALACLDRGEEAIVERAAAVADTVADDEDRQMVETDLASEPWFGI